MSTDQERLLNVQNEKGSGHLLASCDFPYYRKEGALIIRLKEDGEGW